MESQTPDMQAVLERLEKLERVCAEMAQERASFRVVEASAFVLKDSEGRVRAVLQMEKAVPEARIEWEESQEARAVLTLYDNHGQARAQLREGVLMVGKGNDHCAKLVTLEPAGAQLTLIEGPEKERSVAGLAATKDGPQITVLDAQGFKTIIGNVCAGEDYAMARAEFEILKRSADAGDIQFSDQQFSAASLQMIDKDGEVLWRAP